MPKSAKRNPDWSREERILALDLYVREGGLGRGDPRVKELSEILRQLAKGIDLHDPKRFRSRDGVAMKLRNFTSIDPSRSDRALYQVAQGDRDVWEEFANDRSRLREEAERIKLKVKT